MWLPSSKVSDSRWTIISVRTICVPITPPTIVPSIQPESFGTFFLFLEIHADILRRMNRRVRHPLRDRGLSSDGLCQGIFLRGEFPFIAVDAKALNALKTTSIHSAARIVESCATNPIRGGPARKPT